MNIIYKKGDLLEAPERIICHGCNAQGQMGSGIAFVIRQRYPVAFHDYRAVYEAQGNRLDLGQCVFVTCPDGRIVIDAVTQEFFGRDKSRIYVSYDAVRTALRTIDTWARERDDHPAIGFPKIGAGLANGDWTIIAGIIEAEAIHFQPVVYEL